MKSLVDQFADWVRTKPADEEYPFFRVSRSEHGCAIFQFLHAHGIDILSYGDIPGKMRLAACAQPWTFGALATRLAEQSS